MKENNIAITAAGTILKITLVAVILVIAYSGAMKAYAFGYQIFAEEAMSTGTGTTVTVTIVEGKGTMEIGKILEDKGLIKSAKLFYFQEMFSSYKGEIQPGVYELNTSMKPQEMMAIMSVKNETPVAVDSQEEDTVTEETIIEEETSVEETTTVDEEGSTE